MRYPRVSVVIPTRNAVSTIGDAIDSILSQDYPGDLEIVVGDGSDGSDTTQFLLDHYPSIIVVPNPDHNTPSGLNRAIEASSGEIIVRCDSHSTFSHGYIKEAVETMERTGAAVVGGLQVPAGRSLFQRAVGLAMTSFFGSGNSTHKVGNEEGPTDSVYLGVFRREKVTGLGWFDESLHSNQDYELNYRLRVAGETVWFTPALKVDYQPRWNLKELSQQYFRYGTWKARMLRSNMRSMRLRQMAPPVLVMGLLGSAVLAVLNLWVLAVALPFTYIVALCLGSFHLAVNRRDWKAASILPIVLSAMHLSWGIGFLASSLRMGIGKLLNVGTNAHG